MELDDACFGGVSHGPGKRGRGTDQDPTLVGVSLNEQGHPQYGFLEKVPDLTQDTVTQRLQEQVEPQSTWRTDWGRGVCASGKSAEGYVRGHAQYRSVGGRGFSLGQCLHQ